LMRAFQSSMSASLRGPGFWGPVVWVGADILDVVGEGEDQRETGVVVGKE
jgi:hypothetical protein